MSIRTRAYLADAKPEDALKAADAWIAIRSIDAAAHYARGRALFALSQFVDAREAFDRACALDPGMLEAIMLRREADRGARRVRAEVGTQPALELDLPEHLSGLRSALVSGRSEDILRAVARPEHDADPIAKLLHAQCL